MYNSYSNDILIIQLVHNSLWEHAMAVVSPAMAIMSFLSPVTSSQVTVRLCGVLWISGLEALMPKKGAML